MKIQFCIVMVLSFLSASSGFAQQGSHGGEAVVCYNQAVDKEGKPIQSILPLEITNVYLLDYWEWKQSSSRAFNLGAADLSVPQKINLFFDRVAKIDPYLARKLREIYAVYKPAYADRARIPSISDYTPRLGTLVNCVVEQLAVQTKDTVFGQAWVQVDERLYNFLSNDDKAGIAIHEVFYRFALSQGFKPSNSDGVRYFNFIFATDTSDLTLGSYLAVVKDSKLIFDHREFYALYHSLIPKNWAALGISDKDLNLPLEEQMDSLFMKPLESGGWAYPPLKALRDFSTRMISADGFGNTILDYPVWKVSAGDSVTYDLNTALLTAIGTSAKSEVTRSQKGASVEFLGKTWCYYLVNQVDVNQVQVDCKNESSKEAKFFLSQDEMVKIPLLNYFDSFSQRTFLSQGEGLKLEKTFPTRFTPVKKSVEISGFARTTIIGPDLSLYEGPNSPKRFTFWVKIECQAESLHDCSGLVDGAPFNLKPGQKSEFKSKARFF